MIKLIFGKCRNSLETNEPKPTLGVRFLKPKKQFTLLPKNTLNVDYSLKCKENKFYYSLKKDDISILQIEIYDQNKIYGRCFLLFKLSCLYTWVWVKKSLKLLLMSCMCGNSRLTLQHVFTIHNTHPLVSINSVLDFA